MANPNKFEIMFLGVDDAENYSLRIGSDTISATKYVKLLGAFIDNRLNFDIHVKKLCEVANKKIRCLYRIRKFTDEKQALVLSNAYVLSSFRYCPLIWMFCSRTLSNQISRVHERCLKAVFGCSEQSLPQLMESHGMVPVHTMHLHYLMIEVFRSLNSLNPIFMKGFFQEKALPYELSDPNKLELPIASTNKYGINSVNFRSAILWNNLPVALKNVSTLQLFKLKIKKASLLPTLSVFEIF